MSHPEKQTSTRISVPRDRVVLIHGLAARPWMMGLLGARLRRRGFATSFFSYISIRASIPRIADRFLERLMEFEKDGATERTHIVCHSMGGIITRQALLNGLPTKLRRVVMLAPPNHGSGTAAIWGPIVQSICPAAAQLSSQDESYVRRLGDPDFGEWAVLAALHDRVVAVESTRLRRPHQHHVLPTGHMRLLLRRDTARLASRFLKTGQLVDSDECHSQLPLVDATR